VADEPESFNYTLPGEYESDASTGETTSDSMGYTSGDRDAAWKAIREAMNYIASQDTTTEWYGEDSKKMDSPPADVGSHFNDLWGDEDYYATARDAYNDMRFGLRGDAAAGTTGMGDASEDSEYSFSNADLQDSPMLTDDEMFALFNGRTAGEVAQELYDKIIAFKKKGDNRFENSLPPEGSDESDAGRFGGYDGEAGRAALAAADRKALGIAEEEEAEPNPPVAADAPTATSLAFKEQCFLLSKVMDVARFRVQQSKETVGVDNLPKRIPYFQGKNPTPPTNACLQIQGEPFLFLNDLVCHNDTETFLKMPSQEIANLQPEIRFFKVKSNPKGEEVLTEIHFDTNAGDDLKRFLESQNRNIGVGIQDFEVKFQGTNPFSAKKDLSAKLTIFASSFEELLRPRGKGERQYRYVDLALKTAPDAIKKDVQFEQEAFNAKQKGQILDDMVDLDFSIRAVVGVRTPSTLVQTDDALKGAIQRNKVTLEMVPTIHSFDIGQDGTVKFSIEYKPFINEHFRGLTYDVFSDNENNKFILADKVVTAAVTQECSTKQLAEFRRKQAEKISKLREDSMQALIESAKNQGFLRYLYLPNKLLEKINREGPLFEFEELKKAKIQVKSTKGVPLKDQIKKEMKSKKEKEKNTKTVDFKALSPNTSEIPFIYLGDLVDSVLADIDKRIQPENFDKLINEIKSDSSLMGDMKIDLSEEKFEPIIQQLREKYKMESESFTKLRVILGPIELVNPLDPTDVEIFNMGDLPVSLKYFTEFLTGELLQNNRYQFPVDAFLDKLVNKLMSSFLNDDSCFSGAVKQKTRFSRTSFIGYASKKTIRSDDPTFSRPMDGVTQKVFTGGRYEGRDSMFNHAARIYTNLFKDMPIIDVVGNEAYRTGISGTKFMYVVFHTQDQPPISSFKGSRAEDSARGVHHYSVGRDTGIIKEIKLVRDKRKGIAEARFARDGFNGLKQLMEVYHVEITCYANLNVYPGVQIYVDPQGWVPHMDPILEGLNTDLTDFGIGGYYDIVNVEHGFGLGKFETKISAKWVARKASNTSPPAEGKPKPSAAQSRKKAQKCGILKQGESKDTETPAEVPAAREAALQRSLESSSINSQGGQKPSMADLAEQFAIDV